MSVVCVPEWLLGFIVGHLVVLGRKIWREDALRRCIQVYPPVLTIMICQLALYPTFAVVFDQASGTVQVLLTIVFPALKYLMKKILHRYTSELDEFSVEVAVSGVEIASSLFQSMIMQTAPSALAMGIIMGVDVVMGVVSVEVVMDKQSVVPKSHLIRRAYDILETKIPISTTELSTLPLKGSSTLPATSYTVTAGPLPVLDEEISPATVVTPTADDVVVRQALELASAARLARRVL